MTGRLADVDKPPTHMGESSMAKVNVKHSPTYLNAGRAGSWCNCSCGWESHAFGGQAGAQRAFAEHLQKVAK